MRSLVRTLSIAAVVASVVAASPLFAQPTPPAPAGAVSSRLVSEMRPGRAVRVIAEQRYFEGKVQSLHGDTVTLDLGGGTRVVPLANVERAFVQRRATKKGALIGGVTGAALVGAFGLLVVRGFCESPSGCSGDYPTALLFGGGIGFAGGALIGAGIGALAHDWKRVYP